jgi:hypothetical protein
METFVFQLADSLGRTYGVLCGRGTTALWLALRAIRRRDGPGEVIVPDLLCTTALDGVLLAGFTPVFADVIPGRWTLAADSVARRVTPRTRAILVAHLFGHTADLDLIRAAAPGVPVIEDAVQGFGGTWHDQPVGAWGDLSFTSFDKTKMIGGRGGALFFDDGALLDGVTADVRRLPDLPDLPLDGVGALLPPVAAAAYADQLRTTSAPVLLRPFDDSPANLDRIRADWGTLGARIDQRYAKSRWLHDRLVDFPLILPDIRAGDAIWRYTFAAPSVAAARWILRGLQAAGLRASDLYTPLSRLYGPYPDRAHPLVNLPVDESADDAALQRAVQVIAGVPWERLRKTKIGHR